MAFSDTNHNSTFGDIGTSELDTRMQTPSSRGADSADAQRIDPISSSRLYHIYHTAIRYDYRISDADKNHLYFFYNSHLKPLKADITVHAGADNSAPILGVCKFLHLSRHCKVGLGDPEHAGAMVWEDLECQNLTMTKYNWQMSIPLSTGGSARRWFVWKKTRSLGADGASPGLLSLRNFKLVDEMTGRVVGVFTSNGFKSIRKNGKLQLTADYGPQFDIMALITLLAMYERIRRRTGGKGGGGGGGDGG
ncbi:uncharacterized protein BDV14DRAFT_180950 [Aspergillus stella-maris]|uniref:uncharacterized protein n=1 Tax=Aspergillus stella-maris TaxID=1810926 RepID=UPI003CCCB871